MTHTSSLPLAGVRVVEICQIAAGPFCGMLLADMGAEVIKIEPPTGDAMRTWPPITDGGGVICGRIWTPPDCNGLVWSGGSIMIADVYPASLSGPIHCRREPRWISACFLLNAPEASAGAVPVHTSRSKLPERVFICPAT